MSASDALPAGKIPVRDCPMVDADEFDNATLSHDGSGAMGRRARRVPLGPALVIALAIALTGCDPYYSADARAACPGVGVDRVGGALMGDPDLETRRIAEGKHAIQIGRGPIATFWSARGGVTAAVHIYEGPSEVKVTVGSTRRPGEIESRSWEQHREYVCRLLSREIPQVQEWRREDFSRPSSAPWVLAAAVLAVAVVALGWGVLRTIRARRRP